MSFGISRRELLTYSVSGIMLTRAPRRALAQTIPPASNADSFSALLSELENNPEIVDASRGYRELAEYLPDQGLERAPSRTQPSKLEISQAAVKLILTCEISNPRVYEQKYQRPTWPGGLSGVTIGVGYDLGYATADLIILDWSAYLDKNSLDQLIAASGRRGAGAQDLASTLKPITVPWSVAQSQFIEWELPRYVGLTASYLPNFSLLSPDSRGALVSLVFNRGPSFNVPSKKDPTGRYREMRNILTHMSLRNFDAIPKEIESMQRLWSNGPNAVGLVDRRRLEAILFANGLKSG